MTSIMENREPMAGKREGISLLEAGNGRGVPSILNTGISRRENEKPLPVSMKEGSSRQEEGTA
jgi:hypothetical protein